MHAPFALYDLSEPLSEQSLVPATAADRGADFTASIWIEEFIDFAQRALAAEDDEQERRRCEDEVLRRVPYLRAAGLFDIFQIAHPALRAMIDDHVRA